MADLAVELRTRGIINKKWTTHNGKVKGGAAIATMSLHRILRERIYIGELQHKSAGTVTKGEHDGIISRELFDAVQERLKDNSSGKSKQWQRSPNLLSGKLYDANGILFTNTQSGKKGNGRSPIFYYAAAKNYIRNTDVDMVVLDTVREFLNSDLSVLSAEISHNLKQIDYDGLGYTARRGFIKNIIDKAIVADSPPSHGYGATGKITLFIKPDIDKLPQFITHEFINQKTNPMKFIISNDTIIIEQDIVITKGTQLTKYNTGRSGLMTMTENNHMIVRAFTLAFKYKEEYERTGDLKSVIKSEKTSWRTIYKYLNLAYLSPKIVNILMSGKIDMPLRDLFVIASKYDDFYEQEKIFQRIV